MSVKFSHAVLEGTSQQLWNTLRSYTPSAMEVTWQKLTPEERAAIMSAVEVIVTTMTEVALSHGVKESELQPDLHG